MPVSKMTLERPEEYEEMEYCNMTKWTRRNTKWKIKPKKRKRKHQDKQK